MELPKLPATGPLYRRAAIGLTPGLGSARRTDRLPAVELTVRGVTVDRDHLAGYDRVCGFRLADVLPPTYPHVLAFPLALRLMSAPDFPFPLVGLVHVANRVTVHRPVDAAEPLDLSARAVDLRPHARGRQFDVICTGSTGGEVVWRGVSTYLRRERSGPPTQAPKPPEQSAEPPEQATEAPEQATEAPGQAAPSALWRVGPEVGRSYGRISGDHNPIHTSRLAARLFGFSRPIAHGMWSKARCLAALDGRLPDAYAVEVAFKAPLPLPGAVAFAATPGRSFELRDPRGGRPYLLGALTTLSD